MQAVSHYRNTPNRFNGLYGAGHAAELAGTLTKARTYHGKLIDNCKDADSGRAELVSAKNFLQSQNVAEQR